MQKRALNKSTLRDIKGSFGRFFAILAITFLGVGFFSGVRITTPVMVHTILSIALHNKWDIQQLDVHNAFLNGCLTEEVYVAQPQGMTDPTFPNNVCRLQKAIYGLKQASRAWYQELCSFLLSLSFIMSYADTSLFILSCTSSIIYVLVYVDDLIITGSDS